MKQLLRALFLLVNTPNFFVTDAGVVTKGPPSPSASNANYGVQQVMTDYDGTGDARALNFGPFVDLSNGTIADTVTEFDVTSIVNSWQTSGNNFGFNITGEAFPSNGLGYLEFPVGRGGTTVGRQLTSRLVYSETSMATVTSTCWTLIGTTAILAMTVAANPYACGFRLGRRRHD